MMSRALCQLVALVSTLSVDLPASGAVHHGGGNASAAAAVDQNYMVVADDETQVLRIFHRRNTGPAVYARDFSGELGLRDFSPNGLVREVDIEAAASLGDRVFWIGSHGNCSACTPPGEIRVNRYRLFATDIVGTGASATLRYVGRYDALRSDLIRWDTQNLHGKGARYYGLEASAAAGLPPEASGLNGFNVEGLAISPDGRTAYLGFRAPLVPVAARSRALIIPVLNLPLLVLGNPAPGPAIFGRSIELDLDGRGVRGLETYGNGLLIIAGGVTNGGSFRLFSWSGEPGEPARERLADFSLSTPEGIIYESERPPNRQLQLVSDGSRTNAASQFVILGAPVPQFVNPAITQDGLFEFVVFGRPDAAYWLESGDKEGSWKVTDRIVVPFSGYQTWRTRPQVRNGAAPELQRFRLRSAPVNP